MKVQESNYLSSLTQNYDQLLMEILSEDLKIIKTAKNNLQLKSSPVFTPKLYFKKN